MHRVQAQEPGLALRVGLAPLADGDLPAAGVIHTDAPAAVYAALAQVVQMGYRDGGQSLVLRLAENRELAVQDVAHRRSG
jgi:hypothetical protein